jgi:hypothetical protein
MPHVKPSPEVNETKPSPPPPPPEGTHASAFGPVLTSPSGQGAHWRSLIGEGGGSATYSLSTQSFQAVHAVALVVVLKVLASQATQVRLEVGVPASSMCWPGMQLDQAVHVAALVVVL